MDVAAILLTANDGKPKQVVLRRATSTIYYALFHALAKSCADLLIGTSGRVSTSKHAWRQTYRALEHGHAKSQCSNKNTLEKFPAQIAVFASTFVQMQIKRHSADYDPHFRLTKSEVEADLFSAIFAIDDFKNATLKDRRAFCSYVLLKSR